MTTAAAVIGSGFLGSLGGIAWDVMAWVGCIVTGSVVLAVLFLTATAPPRKPRHAPTQPSLVIEVGDDTLAMLRGEMSDAAIEQWLGEGGRNG